MELPISELLGLMIATMFSALGFGLVKGKKPEAALIMFNAGLFMAAIVGLVDIAMPITLTIVLALLLGWKYSREG